MSSVAGSAGGCSAGAGGGGLPVFAFLGDLEHDDVGREALRKVDIGTVDGEGCCDLRRGEGTRDRHLPSRRGDHFVARGDTEIVQCCRQLGGRAGGAAQDDTALRLEAAARAVCGRKRGQRKAVAIADEIGLHFGQNRTCREVLVARVGEPEAAVRGRRGDRAANRNVGGETAVDPVLTERQQIGQVFELPTTLQLQAQSAFGRH